MENFSSNGREMEFFSTCGRIGISQPKDEVPEAAEAVGESVLVRNSRMAFKRDFTAWEEAGGFWKQPHTQ